LPHAILNPGVDLILEMADSVLAQSDALRELALPLEAP